MCGAWDQDGAGVVVLPSGRLVRGRALRRALPEGREPEFGLYLLGREPPAVPWPHAWLRWPDFRLPSGRLTAVVILALGALVLFATIASVAGGHWETTLGKVLFLLLVLIGMWRAEGHLRHPRAARRVRLGH